MACLFRYLRSSISPWLVSLLALWLTACVGPDLSTGAGQQNSSRASSSTERLNAWLDEQYEQQLDFSPELRTILGETRDYDRLGDYTLAAEKRELKQLRLSVADMEKQFDYADLDAAGKLSYDMWALSLDQAEAAFAFAHHAYIFGRGGPHAFLPSFMISYHRVESEADLAAYVARLSEIARVLHELLDRAETASEGGIRQPRFAYEFAIDEIERVIAGVPFEETDTGSPLWSDIERKAESLVEKGIIGEALASDYLQAARQVLTEEVAAAYASVLDWLRQDMQRALPDARGVWALPDGDNYYRHRIFRMTTLDMTPEEIHQTGLQEVARLRREMEKVRDRAGFAGDLPAFFVHLRESDQFYFPNTDQGRQDYLDVNRDHLNRISARLPEFFGRLPKAPLEVRRVEAFREQDGAAQHYRAGSPDGSRPGVFYSHMSDMSALSTWQIENIAYHEGNPGHHMQISIQQELTGVPRFRTQYRSTAYIEGWALYAEWLAREMGGYRDLHSEFGQLTGEMWRAVRLVVDTGIHSKRWSEQQAVDYMLDNSPIPEAAVRSEIQRYFANPGQATAYKIGMLNIQQARRHAEQQLGNRFDIRGFHDVILGAGALPLPLLHAEVESWIKEVKSASR